MDPPRPDRQRPGSGAGEAPEDALRRLERRLDRASDAAERLIAEAAAKASRSAPGPAPPPSGWQAPPSEDDRPRSLELDAVLQFVQSLRGLVPPELQQRLAEALRELLLALRAVIDWYLERTEPRATGSSEVQDIPIQ